MKERMNKNIFCFVFVVFFCIVTIGCVSTQRDYYVEDTVEQLNASEPIRIIDLNNYERAFQTIGHVRIKASEAYPPEMIMSRLKKEGRRMGGHALNDVTQKTIPKKFPRFFDYLNFYDVIWSAEVVRWDD